MKELVSKRLDAIRITLWFQEYGFKKLVLHKFQKFGIRVWQKCINAEKEKLSYT